MHEQVEKPKENKSRTIANSVTQKQSSDKSTFQFVDNRPEAIQMQKLQEMANNSPEAIQMQKLQEMANNSPEAIQMQKLQEMANNTPSMKRIMDFQSREIPNSVAQKRSNEKQGVEIVDKRWKNSGVNLFSKSSIQLRAQGNQQARIQERREELGKIRMPEMIDAPDQQDLDTAGNEIDQIQAQIEGAVNVNVLKEQSHGGNMKELRERFHNDEVWRRYRGGVDEGHKQRTRELKASRITARALDYTKNRVRAKRKVITDDIAQL